MKLKQKASDKHSQETKALKKDIAPAKNNFKIRSQQTIYHHLFKAQLGKFMKDVSYGQEEMKLDSIEHVHHFHSVNSMGHSQKYTNTIGGHFHEVTWSVDQKTGEPIAKCGPPLKKVPKNTARGVKINIEQLQFFNKEDKTYIKDPHTHEMTYMGTDELSSAYVQDLQKQNASFIASQEPKKTSEATITSSDGE